MVSDYSYAPARVYVHDGQGRRLVELVDAIGNRTYRTMEVSQAIYQIPETDPQLAVCDPTLGRILVIESTLYPTVWAGPITQLAGRPASGEMTITARGYEAILQERYLPTDFTIDGSAGAVFRGAWAAMERENVTGVTLSNDIVAGPQFYGTHYRSRKLFDAWNLLAQQVAHEWWLEHAVAGGVLQSQAHFRPARGEDHTADVRIVVGPNGNARVNEWRINTDATSHRIRAIAGAGTTATQLSERPVTEVRASASSPIARASLVTISNSRLGVDFSNSPTGTNPITATEAFTVIESVPNEGALKTAAQTALVRGHRFERGIDLEIVGAGTMWRYVAPGDLVSLTLPPPYFIDGYDGPVAVVSTQPMEHLGVLHIVVQVPNG